MTKIKISPSNSIMDPRDTLNLPKNSSEFQKIKLLKCLEVLKQIDNMQSNDIQQGLFTESASDIFDLENYELGVKIKQDAKISDNIRQNIQQIRDSNTNHNLNNIAPHKELLADTLQIANSLSQAANEHISLFADPAHDLDQFLLNNEDVEVTLGQLFRLLQLLGFYLNILHIQNLGILSIQADVSEEVNSYARFTQLLEKLINDKANTNSVKCLDDLFAKLADYTQAKDFSIQLTDFQEYIDLGFLPDIKSLANAGKLKEDTHLVSDAINIKITKINLDLSATQGTDLKFDAFPNLVKADNVTESGITQIMLGINNKYNSLKSMLDALQKSKQVDIDNINDTKSRGIDLLNNLIKNISSILMKI